MTSTHSNTRKRKYRYYVSLAVTKLNKGKEGSVSKIPAGEIEKFVIESLKEFLTNTKKIQKYIAEYDIEKQKDILAAIKNIKDFSEPRFVRSILNKVIISENSVEINLCEASLIQTLEKLGNEIELTGESSVETDVPIKILKNVEITKTSRSGNILIINSGDKLTSLPNPYLINAIVKSHYWNRLLLVGKVKNAREIQALEGLKDPTYVRDVLNLKFLPPKITEQILNGTQPKDLSLQKLINIKTFISL